ncbi:radical SAM protein [Sporomusa sp.]|uniref:radical SAM protein n=1 Tax=Sporomusa sp. TaxID=2078658 RepID=UPI002B63A7EB|nr:radical SAM protein [Sporomusa sp.]HWR41983.1 radical SAM protein [Sporomusa sp.]
MERVNRLPLPDSIRFAYPQKTKPVSVTGTKCELNCAHCGGHYLKHMKPLDEISDAGADNSASWLVSGGCQADGAVPVAEHIGKLAELKQGRRFNMHVGLVNDTIIEQLATVADCVSFDFVADQATISDVFGNDRTVDDYVACYQSLRRRVKVMPHICIGLNGGEIYGEYSALELLKELGTEALTFIIFMPTRGTRFADRQPPSLAETARLLSHARLQFPDIPLHLGCMRPGGQYREEIDKWAVRIGFDTIVNPAPAAVTLAEKLGLTLSRGEECCVL